MFHTPPHKLPAKSSEFDKLRQRAEALEVNARIRSKVRREAREQRAKAPAELGVVSIGWDAALHLRVGRSKSTVCGKPCVRKGSRYYRAIFAERNPHLVCPACKAAA